MAPKIGPWDQDPELSYKEPDPAESQNQFGKVIKKFLISVPVPTKSPTSTVPSSTSKR